MRKLEYMNYMAWNTAAWTGQRMGVGTVNGPYAGDVWEVEGGYRNSRTDRVFKDLASAIQDLFPRTWITNLPDNRGWA